MTEEKPLTRQEVVDIVVERMKAVSARTSHSSAFQVFQMQADATYTGTPVSGTAVGVLATTRNVRIISATCNPNFGGGASHLIEIVVTIDGITTTFNNAAPATGTPYYAVIDSDAAANQQDMSATEPVNRTSLLEGRSVSVTFELTTDGTPGASSTARVKYATIP